MTRARCQLCGHWGALGGDLITEARRDGNAAILCRDSGACWVRHDQRHGLTYPVVQEAI